MQPLVLFQAIRALLRNKEDTEQVFKAIEASGHREQEKNYHRFAATATGARILDEKRELLETLNDRTRLAQLPEGSLGRAYLAFMENEKISADGLVGASEAAANREPDPNYTPKRILFDKRIRDMHDLWHVVTGYGRDGLGELCLLAFSYAQAGNRAIGLIVLAGAWKGSREFPGTGIWRAVREGYRAGRRARWLPAADWEAMLAEPLHDIRPALTVQTPVAYRDALQRLAAAGYTDDAMPATG